MKNYLAFLYLILRLITLIIHFLVHSCDKMTADDEVPIYDPEILKKFHLGERHETLKQDESLCVRPLYRSDYGRGFLELLGELTQVGNISEEQFQGLVILYY